MSYGKFTPLRTRWCETWRAGIRNTLEVVFAVLGVHLIFRHLIPPPRLVWAIVVYLQLNPLYVLCSTHR
jgi:hypothetical protein